MTDATKPVYGLVQINMTNPEEFRLPEGVGLGEPGAADRAAIRSVEGS